MCIRDRAWSPVRKALYVAFHDFKRILLTQYVDQLPQPPLVVASPYSVDQLTTIAFGADGRGLIGWPEHPSGAALLEGEVVIRAALLNPDGTLRAGPDGSAAPPTEVRPMSAAQPMPGTQSIRRAVAMLEAFTDERPSWSVSDLAEMIHLNRTTAYRLLTALELSLIHI